MGQSLTTWKELIQKKRQGQGQGQGKIQFQIHAITKYLRALHPQNLSLLFSHPAASSFLSLFSDKSMAPRGKPKPSPASSSTQAPSLEDLFATLHRHVENNDLAKVVKVADQVLAIAPGDEDAIHCKVVALIRSEAIDKALNVIKAASSLPIDLSSYKAYCLYRQNKLEEALDLIRGLEKTPMVLQLESQIFYRLGKMDSCIDSYEKLQKLKIDSDDLKANIMASLVAGGRPGEVDAIMSASKLKSSKSYELVYNAACALVEKKKYPEAEEMLLHARRVGQETLMEENYVGDEIEAELATITVQLAYVRQMMGHGQESVDEYSKVIKRGLEDDPSLAIASNNLITLRNGKEVADSLRKLDNLMSKVNSKNPFEFSSGLEFRLNPKQKEVIYSNRVLLLLLANKIDQAQELVSALQEMYPESTTSILLQAAVFVREKKVPKAEEILTQYSNKYPKNCISVLLALAQIAATAGHFQISSEALLKVAEIQHMPATVATLVSLWERLGDINNAASVFDASIEWWKNSMDGERNLLVLMQEAASFKLKHGKEGEAARLYEELVRSKGSVEALVGLVQTAAKSDLDKAEQYEKQLKPLPGLKGVNVEVLEKTSGAKHVEGGSHVAKMEISEEVKKAKAKKRKRKPKYPKGFDPANPGPLPDPERWLPKRERSTYRPKRKDKRAQIRGAQGAVSRDKHDSTATTSGTSGTGVSNSGATSSKAGQAGAGSSKGGSQGAAAGNAEQNKGSSKSRKKKSRN
ncbi:Signal recognition particle subunit SRP72 [Rhynchospora pubera]|uniref:Signal recognition particle subunit SRP72 n=1 Tax=Rhynchospora pubera TaxID=906938 RepID=A0AAV8E3H0_9POAL|nr:Signal recognition particle subunit SRP72 [Rhynchospora pubera]